MDLFLIIIPPFFTSNILTLLQLQIEGKTFEIIQINVLQGSKVILDVEEEGLNERTILSLDAATKISSSGNTCFRSLALDGKEYCFVDAQPGECSLFTGPEEHRRLFSSELNKLLKVVSTTAAQAAAQAAAQITSEPTTSEPSAAPEVVYPATTSAKKGKPVTRLLQRPSTNAAQAAAQITSEPSASPTYNGRAHVNNHATKKPVS